MLARLGLLPLCAGCFKVAVSGLVTASEASECGLGVSRSTRLSSEGVWPCHDVSFLRGGIRTGVEGARRSLLQEYVRVAVVLAALRQKGSLRFKGLGERTKMALRAQERIASKLGRARVGWCSPRAQGSIYFSHAR